MLSGHVTNTYKPKSSHGTFQRKARTGFCLGSVSIAPLWDERGCLSAGVRGVRVLTVQIMIITRAASVQPVSLSLEKISLEPDIIVMSQAPSSKLSLESM